MRKLAIDNAAARLAEVTAPPVPALAGLCRGSVDVWGGPLRKVAARLADEADAPIALARSWAIRLRYASRVARGRTHTPAHTIQVLQQRACDVLALLLSQGVLAQDADAERAALGALADLEEAYRSEPEGAAVIDFAAEAREEPEALGPRVGLARSEELAAEAREELAALTVEEPEPAPATSSSPDLVELLAELGPSRASDLAAALRARGQDADNGATGRKLAKLTERGLVRRVERGVYEVI